MFEFTGGTWCPFLTQLVQAKLDNILAYLFLVVLVVIVVVAVAVAVAVVAAAAAVVVAYKCTSSNQRHRTGNNEIHVTLCDR